MFALGTNDAIMWKGIDFLRKNDRKNCRSIQYFNRKNCLRQDLMQCLGPGG